MLGQLSQGQTIRDQSILTQALMSSLGLDKGGGGGGAHIFLIFALPRDDSSVKVTLSSGKTFRYMKGNSPIYILRVILTMVHFKL